jgi:acyl-CoA dehydrogenase
VAAIERKLRDAIGQGRLDAMPQSVAHIAQWGENARQLGLLDAGELRTLEDYARQAAEVIKVDDFPPDFGLLASLQQRKEALEIAVELAA